MRNYVINISLSSVFNEQQRPELAKLGNALWNAETEEDVVAFQNVVENLNIKLFLN